MTGIKQFWTNYCENSSLHGLRYVVHKDAKPLERLIWTALLAVAGALILVHLYGSWETYSYSSMEIIVDNPRYPLTKIDFPAITICSINKILYSKAKDKVLSKYANDSVLRRRYENTLYVLNTLQYPTFRDLSYFIRNNPVINLPTKSIKGLMLKLMPTIDEMFDSCLWRGYKYNCTDLFRLQRTEEGFCYSFNSKTSERTENDSSTNPPIAGPDGTLIPLRNNAAGKMTGLEVILKSLNTEYFPSDHRAKGFNIMIHTPEDFPDISRNYKIHSELNLSLRISVSVSHIKADVSLKRIDENVRNCFLYKLRTLNDDNLPSYRSNAEDNCYSKCRILTTNQMCNCTPYYFDVRGGIEQHCGIEDLNCLGKMNVLQRNVQAPEDEPGFPKWSIPDFMNCSCPHPCSFIGYTTELRNYAEDFMSHTEYPGSYMHIDIHYKERFAISYQRAMKYTTQDLLVTFGGMASLFLGCSLVSLVEIIYVVYKSLVMLKHKYTKVNTVSGKQRLVLRRRHHAYRFCRPLYKPPEVDDISKKISSRREILRKY